MTTLAFLAVLALGVAATPVELNLRNGKFRPLPVPSNSGIGSLGLDPNKYLIFLGAMTWDHAKMACMDLLPGQTELLTIESQQELKYINEALGEDLGSGIGDYWTSGTCSAGTPRKFIWETVKTPLESWVPWAPKYPPTIISPQHRVLLRRTIDKTEFYAFNGADTMASFICELTDPSVPVPCEHRNDLIIALDSSGSIGVAEYQKALDFVARLVKAFNGYSGTRVSLVLFSHKIETLIKLDNTLSPSQLEAVVLTAPYHAGNTATNLAIDSALAQFASHPRSVPKNMLIVTDGFSNNPALTAATADIAKGQGIRMISVGIGLQNDAELLKLAEDNPDHMFQAKDFDELLNLLFPVSVSVCPAQ